MKNNKVPMRKCIGCNTSKPKSELVRIAFYEGEASVDLTGKAKGRGVYVCKDEDCLKKIYKKKGFVRTFGQDLTDDQKEKLLAELKKHEKNQ